jgi:hypothetical protein
MMQDPATATKDPMLACPEGGQGRPYCLEE